jgi:hypothetical protein
LLGTAWGLELLFTQLLVIELASVGFLKVANLNVDSGDFFVKVTEVADIGGNTPIVELSSRCNHGKELGVQAIDNGSKPAWECFDGFIGGVGGGSIDGDNVGRVTGPVMGGEGCNFAIIETFDPLTVVGR